MMDQQLKAFQIIAKAGDAFSKQMEGLTYAREGKISEALSIVEEAKKDLAAAHQVQTEILTAEAQGIGMEITPIVVHAQDHLTKAQMGDFFVKEQINLYQRLIKIEEK